MFKAQLDGYRLTTAKIIYHQPDYPSLLQEFIWQHLDMAPTYPKLVEFLDFWQENLDGPIHSVVVGAAKVIMPPRFGFVETSYSLH